MEVSSPNSTYELTVKTEMKSGVAVPKGRINLPRETKPKSQDQILVFAEGRQADEARKAGAHIVGGPELIDGVRPNLIGNCALVFIRSIHRSSITAIALLHSFVHRLLSVQSHLNWAVFSVLEA